MYNVCPIAIEYALENASASNYEDLESAEGWIAECFKDAEMQLCPDNSYASKNHCKFMTYTYYLYKIIL